MIVYAASLYMPSKPILLQDVACTTPLSEAVAAKLNGLPNALGQSYQEFLGTIDNDTLRKLEEATR